MLPTFQVKQLSSMATRSRYTVSAFAYGALMRRNQISFAGALIVCPIGAGRLRLSRSLTKSAGSP